MVCLCLGLTSRHPGRRHLPDRPGHVVRTPTDHITHVLRPHVDREDPQDAVLGRRRRRRGAVDEWTGRPETNIELTQLFRMLQTQIIYHISTISDDFLSMSENQAFQTTLYPDLNI